jgi:oligoendopeptidase F
MKSLKSQAGARDNYLNILKAGGSAYPYDLVKSRGRSGIASTISSSV